MKVVLPWPDSRLSPNAKRRTHWRTYNGVAAQARQDATYLTYDQLPCGLREARQHFAGEGKIAYQVTFYPPDKRHRDDDGMIGSFKHARDGIADALAINDRRFSPHYIFADPEKPGRVEVVLSPVSGAFGDKSTSPESADSATQKIGPSGAPTPPSRDPISNQERTE